MVTPFEYLYNETMPTVYPNPATNYFRVGFNMSESAMARLELIDQSGRLVFEKSFNSHFQAAIIELNDIPTGLYTWNIVSDSKTYSGKIEIQ